MSLGQKIKALRKARNISQVQLAEITGVSTMSIRRYETGTRVPNRVMAEKILACLGENPEIYQEDLQNCSETHFYEQQNSERTLFLASFSDLELINELQRRAVVRNENARSED